MCWSETSATDSRRYSAYNPPRAMINIEAWCNVKNSSLVPIDQVVSNPKYRREEIMSRSSQDAPSRLALDWPHKNKGTQQNMLSA